MTAVELRNGEVTRDVRLDRQREIDLRSLNYSIASVLGAKESLPRSYTWRVDERLDQGQEGACVGFGWSCELAARPSEVEDVTDAFARESIYWQAQRTDEYEGGAYPGADPFSEGSSVLAGAKVCQSLGFFSEYRWALTLEDLVLAVGYKGPAVIGIDWYEGMYDPDADGFIHPAGQIVGGHCICIIGVHVELNEGGKIDPLRSWFLLQNSWGASWGMDGRCRLTVVEMMKLWPGGDFCIPLHRARVRHGSGLQR
jgi:C1A family cysteine protease